MLFPSLEIVYSNGRQFGKSLAQYYALEYKLMNLWYPMKSAPKTGEPILLYYPIDNRPKIVIAYWDATLEWWIFQTGGQRESQDYLRYGVEPTCWYPLPELPKES